MVLSSSTKFKVLFAPAGLKSRAVSQEQANADAISLIDSQKFLKMLSSETEQLSIQDATERSGYGDYSSRDAAFIARRILSQITMNQCPSCHAQFL